MCAMAESLGDFRYEMLGEGEQEFVGLEYSGVGSKTHVGAGNLLAGNPAMAESRAYYRTRGEDIVRFHSAKDIWLDFTK